MAIRIHNTLTKRKEDLVLGERAHVGMYVCGPTVYDSAHLGHARAALVFDVVRRHLRFRGCAVRFVRNITDLDDKIIQRAAREGTDWRDVAARYAREYREDMAALGVLPPDVEPLATEHIGDMIALIEKLVASGHAYAVDSGVYFSVQRFSRYGGLSAQDLESVQAGARVEVDARKRSPEDFALWKSARPGEPTWESPWGPGRPGWHIECSAMSAKHIGLPLDIHGGGADLIFPHHENEIAQSEAAFGVPLARFWIHNAMITVNQEKMAKSLGNFFTIREALKRWDPETVRLFLLRSHYRSPIDFNPEALDETEKMLERFYATARRAEEIILASGMDLPSPDLPGVGGAGGVAPAETASAEGVATGPPPAQKVEDLAAMLPARDSEAAKRILDLVQMFTESMDDDFNTAGAIGNLFDAVRDFNRYLDEPSPPARKPARLVVSLIAKTLFQRLGGVLGIFTLHSAEFEKRRADRRFGLSGLSEDEVARRVEERLAARRRGDWAAADAIRRELAEAAIVLEDRKDGTTRWRVGGGSRGGTPGER